MTDKKLETTKKSAYADVLDQVGLTEKEALVYEILLKNGQQGIKEILPQTSLKRGDLYNILYSLRDKNIIEESHKHGKIQFRPADPYKVKEYIDNQKQRFVEASSMISSILPLMLSEYNLSVAKPSVRFGEGVEGLKKIYDELNQSKTKELLLFRSIYDNDTPEYDRLVKHQVEKQVELKIKTRALTPLSEMTKETFLNLDKTRLVERRIIEREKFSLPAEILVWDNTVALISLKTKIIATIVENKDIAQTFKTLFEFIWESSTNYHESVTQPWLAGSLKDNSSSRK